MIELFFISKEKGSVSLGSISSLRDADPFVSRCPCTLRPSFIQLFKLRRLLKFSKNIYEIISSRNESSVLIFHVFYQTMCLSMHLQRCVFSDASFTMRLLRRVFNLKKQMEIETKKSVLYIENTFKAFGGRYILNNTPQRRMQQTETNVQEVVIKMRKASLVCQCSDSLRLDSSIGFKAALMGWYSQSYRRDLCWKQQLKALNYRAKGGKKERNQSRSI